jgi:hypothetical protein
MMIMKNNVCVLIITALICFTGAETDCKGDLRDRCLLTAYVDKIDPSEDDLNKACNGIENISSCLKNANCSLDDPKINSLVLSQKDGFNYLCQEANKKIYLSDVKCLRSASMKQKLDDCDKALSLKANHSICEAMNITLDCRAAEVKICAPEAANVFNIFSSKIHNSSAERQDCASKQPEDPGKNQPEAPAKPNSGVVQGGPLLFTLFNALLLAELLHKF